MIIHGDCLEVMKTFPNNHFSAIVTDPPYGLSFMGKEWDHAIPGKEYWLECFRILRPGSFLLAMGGTRTFHRLACAIEEGGFEIRDCLSWIYGSGFPKSHNHFGLEGYGTALKPAWEPIIMAMKPCEGTFKQNAEKWGQAGINIDGCRIASEPWTRPSRPNIRGGNYCNSQEEPIPRSNDKGRWPANVILDEEAGEMLDEQSGNLKSGQLHPLLIEKYGNCYGKFRQRNVNEFSDNEGGASRFFYCAKASSSERNEGLEGLPLKETEDSHFATPRLNDLRMKNEQKRLPKQNNHPTVKPLRLMEYLIKLVMPPSGGLLLDPFAGSGTTILAAKRLGFEAIGIEKDKEYSKIANQRIESSTPRQKSLF